MSKKHFIELADHIKKFIGLGSPVEFTQSQIESLADFCASQNPNFKRERWLDYIAGKCGKNGGKIS